MNKDTWQMIERVKSLGITESDAFSLRRISMTLHRWFELECGDGNSFASWSIERDETTDKPYMVYYPNNGKSYRHAVADREKGAYKRLAAIMARYPLLMSYVQGDPRGCALYILTVSDIPACTDISSIYNRGVAVYK